MSTDNVQICYFTSDDPRGQLLDLMRFVKQELRSIGVNAEAQRHLCTANLTEDAVTALEKIWQEAIHTCGDPARPYPSEQGTKTAAEASEHAAFDLMVKRHWGWLSQNWRSVLPEH